MYYFQIKSIITHLLTNYNFELIDPYLFTDVTNFFPKDGKSFQLRNGTTKYFENIFYKCSQDPDKEHFYAGGTNGIFRRWKDVFSYLYPNREFILQEFVSDIDGIIHEYVLAISISNSGNDNLIIWIDSECLNSLMSSVNATYGYHTCKEELAYKDRNYLSDRLSESIQDIIDSVIDSEDLITDLENIAVSHSNFKKLLNRHKILPELYNECYEEFYYGSKFYESSEFHIFLSVIIDRLSKDTLKDTSKDTNKEDEY